VDPDHKTMLVKPWPALNLSFSLHFKFTVSRS